MRSFLISLIFFFAILCGAFLGHHALSQQVTTLCATLNLMESALLDGDWPTAQQQFDQLQYHWHDQQHLWRLMVDHERLTEMDANLLRVGAYIYTEDEAQGLAELTALQRTYQNTVLLEQVTWDNIL